MRANTPTDRSCPRLFAHLVVGLALFSSGAVLAQAPGESTAVIAKSCDHNCLSGFVDNYMDALAHQEPARARFAKSVRFTENDVEMPVGEGLWGSVSGVAPTGLEVADTDTGNAAWLGTVEEHGVPAYYAMRLKVEDGLIVEVETVVDRKTALPAPFGDPKQLVHDPAFAQVLPAEERRSRERLTAVANGYFSTVEVNDGQVLTSFDPDCQRTENGISTTRGASGAASIAQGCEAQFKLGIYRINKRVRERRFLVVDEERGVVVATGFFDHANAFDTYNTADGQVRKTALKWPNSLSLMEAFKIKNGLIYRVEAVFTYIPYFMHSPWTGPGAAYSKDLDRKPSGKPCARDCLIHAADEYMTALVAQDPSRVTWAKSVRYTENSVAMMIGDGVWATATAKSPNAQYVADPSTGNVAWYGTIDEHGQPAYYAMRLKVEDGKICQVEAVIERKGDGGPFGDPANDTHDPAFSEVLPPTQRTSRSKLIALADGYFNTLQQNNGTLHTKFDSECARQENGISTTSGSGAFARLAQGCEAQFKLGQYRYDERVRGRRFFAVDAERGVVVASGYIDHAARIDEYQTTDGATQHSPFKYPNSLQFMERFKIRDGKIYRVEAIFTIVPYNLTAQWNPPER